jgi:hypothetical protein
MDDRFVLMRSDTEEALSVVSGDYQVVQPKKILEFYRDLTRQCGYSLETAGALKGGRKVWALARTGIDGSVGEDGQDQLAAYLLLATSCDKTLATTAAFTSIRVVCQNTLSFAANDFFLEAGCTVDERGRRRWGARQVIGAAGGGYCLVLQVGSELSCCHSGARKAAVFAVLHGSGEASAVNLSVGRGNRKSGENADEKAFAKRLEACKGRTPHDNLNQVWAFSGVVPSEA